jgi:NADPH:quinone reductase-like Zn-dependent oxidoreductase
VARKPQNLSFVEAASVPLAALTAWDGLVEHGHLKAGQRVLIQAGAGGVGVYAIQLAKALGAQVFTTTSAGNRDFVKDLGADEVVDYHTEDFAQRWQGLDLVFDLLGGSVQESSFQVLKPGGHLVSIVQPPSTELARLHQVDIAYFFLQPDGKKLAQLGEWLEQGKLRPVVGKVFALADARAAHALSMSGHAKGKIVLQVKK